MNNIISYYYDLNPDEIIYKNNNYYFSYLNSNYVFFLYDRPLEDIDELYKLNRLMIDRKLLVHKMVINKDKKLLTSVNNKYYVLLEVYVNNLGINLIDITNINNGTYLKNYNNLLNRTNWDILWENKIDYYEEQIGEISEKYPLLISLINYYIGLSENAILYYKYAKKITDDAFVSVCNKRIRFNDDLFSLYNPLNYIYDYRVRDVAEYTKSLFMNDKDALTIIKEYINMNNLSYKELLLLYSRLLFPSYFFDLYDDIVNNNLDEELIIKITSKSIEYESFLNDVYNYISGLYNKYIPKIDWIIKRSY